MALGLALGGSLSGQTHAAAVITSAVTFNAGTSLYHYSYSVQNTGLEDLALISIPADPASSVLGIMAPVGFDLTFDPSQGWLNLNEDNNIFTNQTFAVGSTVAPFQFDSPLAPGNVTFSAFDVTGTEFNGTAQAPVPEASTAMLSSLVGLVAATCRRRQA